MALQLPDFNEIAQRSATDVQNQLPQLSPQVAESFVNAFVVSFSGRVSEVFDQLGILEREIFPDTATEENQDRWAELKGLSRLPASKASGPISITGTNGAVIPAGTTYQSTSGVGYVTTAEGTINNQSLTITSLTRIGSVATAETSGDHNLTSAVPVTISGADQSEYNIVNQTVTITGLNTFEFAVTGSPVTPATGTILVAFTLASVNIESTSEGAETNLALNAPVTIGSPIAGVNTQALVQFGTVGGGTDEETDTQFKDRYTDAYANPVANFNVAAIEKQVRQVPGVTRVFVEEITPEIGDVTVFFTRDDDVDIIPDASEVQTVQDQLLLIKPAHMSDASAIVSAPTAVPVAFTFTALDPNTLAVRDAIELNLDEFFRTGTSVGETLTEDKYRSIIQQTISLESGDQVDTFTLSAPSGDVAIVAGELATLGPITFS